MHFKHSLIAATLALSALAGCNSNNAEITHSQARFATFNLSFDRATYETLVSEMSFTHGEQSALLQRYQANDSTLTTEETETAKRIIQIRNVAETIQRVRPDTFVLAEFNNDGSGEDMQALDGFQNNYLSHSQNGQSPIEFVYRENFATNTGKPSGQDLNLDGNKSDQGDDAWGFGFYHGQYAFAVFSRFKIDEPNIRSFQDFRWKDMPGENNLKIVDCDKALPEGKACGDSWYSNEAWEQFPLSSKNHVDVPVIIPTKSGEQVVHFLVSHPAPPIFDNPAKHNTERNRAELKFWQDYIENQTYIYDDNGLTGGLPLGSHFVIAGDLNADHQMGDGDRATIAGLLSHTQMNVESTLGSLAPASNGGEYCLSEGICQRNQDTPHPANITSTSGLRLDYVIPSATLAVKASGVFWPSGSETGYHLVYDAALGNSKGVSSDHRMVWVDIDFNQ